MRVQPELPGRERRIDAYLVPPYGLVTATMQFAMMTAAKRNGELVADLAPERRALCKAQVMGIGGTAATDEAGLLNDISYMLPVAQPAGLREGQGALINTDRMGRNPACLGFDRLGIRHAIRIAVRR
jgi:hypothetical protein